MQFCDDDFRFNCLLNYDRWNFTAIFRIDLIATSQGSSVCVCVCANKLENNVRLTIYVTIPVAYDQEIEIQFQFLLFIYLSLSRFGLVWSGPHPTPSSSHFICDNVCATVSAVLRTEKLRKEIGNDKIFNEKYKKTRLEQYALSVVHFHNYCCALNAEIGVGWLKMTLLIILKSIKTV